MNARNEFGRPPHLFCFGLGYTARALAARLRREGWRVSGTTRTGSEREALERLGIDVHPFDGSAPLACTATALKDVTDILSSAPPDAEGDPVLRHLSADVIGPAGPRWIGYLSTTGVYGNTGGKPIDETGQLEPTGERGRRRVLAERQWLDLLDVHGLPVHVFRLAGIYGPGRSAFDQIRSGAARRVQRPGHVFSRIHVDDIATILRASMARPDAGRIYNVCDDEPAEPSVVLEHACALLGVAPPPAVPFEQAMRDMSPMARSFWNDHRRVLNARIKRELGIELAYPDYRAGLRGVLATEGGR